MKLAFVAIRNSHSKRRRLCVVVAVSRRGFVAGSRLPSPREGCWPARLHSLRLIIFTRGLSSVRAPENRSFLPPLLLCHRSLFLPPFITYSRDNFKCLTSCPPSRREKVSKFFLFSSRKNDVDSRSVSNFRDNGIFYFFFDGGMFARDAFTRKIVIIVKFILARVLLCLCQWWRKNCDNF